jgi:predicted signal transduction protein with EAL and GGDEF domain
MKKEQLDGLLSRSSTIIFTLAFGLITVIIVTLIKENRSIAERERAEEKIHHLAHYDTLTDLPNSFLFKEHRSRALVSAQRNGEMLAVLFVDLDDFKKVNDTCGHRGGDPLLQDVADRFEKTLRKSDVLARQGDGRCHVHNCCIVSGVPFHRCHPDSYEHRSESVRSRCANRCRD